MALAMQAVQVGRRGRQGRGLHSTAGQADAVVYCLPGPQWLLLQVLSALCLTLQTRERRA